MPSARSSGVPFTATLIRLLLLVVMHFHLSHSVPVRPHHRPTANMTTSSPNMTAANGQDIFVPVSAGFPARIPSRNDHPVPKLGIVSGSFFFFFFFIHLGLIYLFSFYFVCGYGIPLLYLKFNMSLLDACVYLFIWVYMPLLNACFTSFKFNAY